MAVSFPGTEVAFVQLNDDPGGDPYSGGEMQFSDDSGLTWTDVADIGHPANSYADADFEEWADVCP